MEGFSRYTKGKKVTGKKTIYQEKYEKKFPPSVEPKCVLDCSSKSMARAVTGLLHWLDHGWNSMSGSDPPAERPWQAGDGLKEGRVLQNLQWLKELGLFNPEKIQLKHSNTYKVLREEMEQKQAQADLRKFH